MNDRTVAKALAAATAAQGGVLVVMGGLGGRAAVQVAAVAAALALLVHEAWRFRLRMNHRVDMALVMAAFGGLGMALGWWLDVLLGTPAGAMARAGGHAAHAALGHGHHAAHAGGAVAMVFSFMTGGMLLGAIPPGLVLTRCARLAREGWRRWVSTHVVGNLAMVAGMVWLGHLLGPALGAFAGSRVVGMHVAMVLGMLLGMEAGMFLGEAALGLAPWREFTWRGGSSPAGGGGTA